MANEIIESADTFVINSDDKRRLTEFFDAYAINMEQISDLRTSTNDMAKALAEQLNVKPKNILTAARLDYKSKRKEANEDHDIVDNILEATGRGDSGE